MTKNKIIGKFFFPTPFNPITPKVNLSVAVIDGDRYFNEKDIRRLLNVLGVHDVNEIDKHRKIDEWVSYKAFHKIFMREYLSFDNPRIQAISKAIFNVGIIPLIDEATGYQYLRPKGELQEIFSRGLKGK